MGVSGDIKDQVQTLVELLLKRAEKTPDATVYTFLPDNNEEPEHITYGELHRKASAIAAQLSERDCIGERAVVLYPAGIDFICGFFGCLYAGVIAVTAYPPRKNHNLNRLLAIINDCEAKFVLTLSKVGETAKPMVSEVSSDFAALDWLYSDEIGSAWAKDWRPIEIAPDSVAFLQYTSGSTGSPKGVKATHRNLIHNERQMSEAMQFGADMVFVSWLPLYHDMGLIGATLQPLFQGGRSILMSPAAFARNPMRWLQAISDYRANGTAAPNFAYELCVQKITTEQMRELDLSCLKTVISGAEMVRADTLANFVDTFAQCGLKSDVIFPLYGLAEAMLFVTGSGAAPGLVKYVDVDALKQHHIKEVPKDSRACTALVGLGETHWGGQRLLIVDPETQEALPDGAVGEIWVQGENISPGYWQNIEATRETFHATLANGEGGAFMRTGDLGTLLDRQLFFAGRIKELIVIRGENYYPQDIERAAAASHESLEIDSTAAFSVEIDGSENLVIVQEVKRTHRRSLDVPVVARAVRQAIAEQFELQVYSIIFLYPNKMLKTSAGKIQRRAMREGYLDGNLRLIAESSLEKLDASELEHQQDNLSRAAILALPAQDRVSALLQEFKTRLSVLSGIAPSSIHDEDSLLALGLDSIAIAEMASTLHDGLAVPITQQTLLELDHLKAIAENAAALLSGANVSDGIENQLSTIALEQVDDEGPWPLSYPQQSLWFLDKFEQAGSAYNLSHAMKLRGPIDMQYVNYALAAIVQRHEPLRTRYLESTNGPEQQVLKEASFELMEENLEDLPSTAKLAAIQGLATADRVRPFDLSSGKLLRSRLLRCGMDSKGEPESVLIITVHHIAVDGWSLNVFQHEFCLAYQALDQNRPIEFPPLALQYKQFARWQRGLLTDDYLEPHLDYWKEKLSGAPVLELPSQKQRPSVRSGYGASYSFVLPQNLVQQLKQQAKRENVSVYMMLLASFNVLLYRYSASTDISIGSPIAGRLDKELQGLVGYFVNTLVLRTDLSDNPAFKTLLKQVKQTTLEAYKHQSVPFDRLVEALKVKRDVSYTPLYQVMFAYQNSPSELALDNFLGIEALPLDVHSAKFDLTLNIHEQKECLLAEFEYSLDLFDGEYIERMALHFESLLRGIVADIEAPLSAIPMLGNNEMKELLVGLSSTAGGYGRDHSLVELFEAQVRAAPQKVALIDCESFDSGSGAAATSRAVTQLTYAELNSQANRLARHLVDCGAGEGSLIGICTVRNSDLIVAVLAVLKSGATYVPLDPNYPKTRIQLMLQDAEADIVLSYSTVQDSIIDYQGRTICLDTQGPEWAEQSTANLNIDIDSTDLAYVIYTSGSTGKPKGVEIEHRNAAAMVLWSHTAFNADELQGVLFGTSICFDLSVWEIFTTLTSGGSLIIVENYIELPYLPKQAMQDKVTLINAVPSAIAVLNRLNQIPRSVKVINLAGEALNQNLVDSLYELDHVEKVHDLYGPSEDTTYSTFGLREPHSHAHIGRPISNTQAYLVDAFGALVPKGLPGELYLAGWGVTRGYRKRPDLTAEKYLANPFLQATRAINSEQPVGDRVYRTGDLARYLADGKIEYLGRIDHQVKIRGFRIELGEVESILTQHEAVRESLVITQKDESDQTLMVAYVVLESALDRETTKPDIKSLQAYVKAKLPEYMVPATLIFLDKFPLTPNGKVDRAALPTADLSTLGSTDYVAPTTDIEAELCKVWEAVLGRSNVGVRDDFFALGGHSLMATQIVARIRESFSVELLVRDLFRSPCIAELAEVVAKASESMAYTPAAINVIDRNALLDLSSAQKRIWFLDQMESRNSGQSTSNSYNMSGAIKITGDVDVEAFAWAFDQLIQRHESLRTNIKIVDGIPRQVIHDSIENFIDVRDLSGEPEHLLNYLIKASRLDEASRSFDIEFNERTQRTRLIRTRFLKLGEKDYILMVTLHHLIADGWSEGVLLDEIFQLYAAYKNKQPNPFAPLAVQYADYAHWQNARIANGEYADQIAYWKQELDGVPVLDLLTDFPRTAARTHRGSRINFMVPRDLSERYKNFCQQQGITLFMGLVGGLAILLQRSSGQDDFCIGTPIANRTHQALEGMIGCFINPLGIRTRLSDDPTVEDVLAQIREHTLNAYSNQDVPFEVLVNELDVSADLSRSPVFQVMFSLQNTPKSSELQTAGLEVEILDNQAQSSKYDLTIAISDDDGELAGEWEYNTDIFKRETIALYVRHFKQILEAIIKTPSLPISRLNMLSEEERALLIREVAGGGLADRGYHVEASLPELFEQQVAREPNKVAITFEEQEFTYAELNARANRLAHYLVEEGVTSNMLVGVCLERGIDMIVAVLGVLKSGGAYLPLDPSNPKDRIRYILDDALSAQRVRLLITHSEVLSAIPTGKAQTILLDDEQELINTKPMDNLKSVKVTQDQNAYVIYTSGTTGKPKGVIVSHVNVTRLFSATDAWFDFKQDNQVWTLFHSIAFDFSVWEIWGALLHGGRLLIVPYLVSRSPEATYTLVVEEKVTVLSQTPSAFLQLIQADKQLYPEGAPLKLRQVIFGGEALDFVGLKPWVDKYSLDTPQLINMYGITETTVHVTYHRLVPADFAQNASIVGVPIPDLSTVVVDTSNNPVPITHPGELLVGGAGVTKGYLNRPDVTAERFVENPWQAGKKLYRTGDLVRRLHDGQLEYLGRIDDQVKIRGFRIELGEIESVLLTHSGVKDAVAIVREDRPGDRRIVAYVAVGSSTTAADLKAYSRKRLPEYMVPAHIVLLDKLPLTVNGKVDKAALEKPQGRDDSELVYIGPRNDTEQRIAEIWCEVLVLERVGVLDAFFDVGGNSLLATQVISRIRSEFDVDLPLSSLFEQPNIEAIALSILEAEANDIDDDQIAAMLAELDD